MNISKVGTFRLVEESTLEAILSTSEWFQVLRVPPRGAEALGFALRFFRVSKDHTIKELADQTGIHRNQIRAIENGSLKKRPQKNTLLRLSSVLGEDFKRVVELQGYL